MNRRKWYRWIGMGFLIPSFIMAVAKEGEELQTLDHLIASTERQLVIHRELRTRIADFQKQQNLFHEGQQTKELAEEMVRGASQILTLAEQHQLLHLFTPFFVEELKLFSGIAKKRKALP